MAIALNFEYKREIKSLLLNLVFVAINYIYIFINTEYLLVNTNKYFYVAIVTAIMYTIINVLLIKYIYKYHSAVKENENEVLPTKSISQALSYINGCSIVICLLAYTALIFAIEFKIPFVFVFIGMIILFLAIFVLNLIKYKLVLSFVKLEYSRVVIIDSICILIGMHLNYILCKYFFIDGFPAGIAIIILVSSMVPILSTNNKINNVNKLK